MPQETWNSVKERYGFRGGAGGILSLSGANHRAPSTSGDAGGPVIRHSRPNVCQFRVVMRTGIIRQTHNPAKPTFLRALFGFILWDLIAAHLSHSYLRRSTYLKQKEERNYQFLILREIGKFDTLPGAPFFKDFYPRKGSIFIWNPCTILFLSTGNAISRFKLEPGTTCFIFFSTDKSLVNIFYFNANFPWLFNRFKKFRVHDGEKKETLSQMKKKNWLKRGEHLAIWCTNWKHLQTPLDYIFSCNSSAKTQIPDYKHLSSKTFVESKQCSYNTLEFVELHWNSASLYFYFVLFPQTTMRK